MKPSCWFMMDFLKTEEALAKNRIVSIASSTIMEGNPGRKKTEEHHKASKKLCESYPLLTGGWPASQSSPSGVICKFMSIHLEFLAEYEPIFLDMYHQVLWTMWQRCWFGLCCWERTWGRDSNDWSQHSWGCCRPERYKIYPNPHHLRLPGQQHPLTQPQAQHKETESIKEMEQMHFSMFEGFYLSDLIYFV